MPDLRAKTLIVSGATELVTETCCACGVLFAMPAELRRNLLRLREKGTFYCPNGHSQCYTGKTDTERLREERERATLRERALSDQLRAAIRDAETQRVELLRIQSRVANGVCPCCNRSFQNVRAHMQTEHPTFAADLPKHTARGTLTFDCSCGASFHTFKGLRIHQGRSRGDEWDNPDARSWASHLTVVTT